MPLISVACIFASAIALILSLLTLRLNPRSSLNWAVSGSSFLYGLWALGSSFTFSATDADTFWIALRFAFAGYIPIQVMAIAMLLVFTGVRGWKAAVALLAILIPSLVELYQSSTGIWIVKDYHSTPWGNVGTLNTDGPWLVLDVFKGTLASVLALFLLVSMWKRSTSRKVRAIVLQLAGLSVFTTLATSFFVNVVWLTWGLPDPTVLLGSVVVISYAYLMSRFQHLAEELPIAEDKVFRSLRELVLVADPQGKVIQVSPRMARLWGKSEAELRGTSLSSFFPDWTQLESTWSDLAHEHQPIVHLAVDLGSSKFLLGLTPVLDKFNDLVSVFVRLEPVHRLDEATILYGISGREREVANLVLEGLGTQEIADALYIALATVKNHLHSLYLKTETANRSELVRLLLTGPDR